MTRRTITALALSVGALAAGTATLRVTAEAPQATAAISAPSVHARLAGLERGVEQAEAIRDVKRVQHAYGHYLEFGLWNDVADLFAERAVARFPSGTYTGRENVRRHLVQNLGAGKVGIAEGQLMVHLVMEPVVTFDPDGTSVRGRWHVLSMRGEYGKSARWDGGIYENQYVKENGVWKIGDLHYHPLFSGLYEDAGWKETPEGAPYHYDPTRAGIPIPEITAAASAAGGAADLATLASRLAALDARVRQLNDEAAVLNVQHSYGYYVDRKMWDDVADLFAADGSMELDLRGVYAGQTSIRRALEQFGPPGLKEGELNDHLQLDTVVHVAPDGRTARARGIELRMVGVNGQGGDWVEGIFENEYVKDGAVWKIKSMHVYPRMVVDYYKGWKDAKPAAGPNPAFPPDRPSTGAYAVYPKVFYPPFHYTNPATGKAPQYPAGVTAAKATLGRFGTTPSANGAARPRNLADLETAMAETERLLAVATARDGAENVANAYGYYIDDFLWDDTGALFARDGWKELSYIGTYVGRDRVTQSMKMRYGNRNGRNRGGNFQVHQKTQAAVTVAPDGKSARIRTRLFQLGGGNNGSWIGGIYENQARLEDGVWKIAGMDLDYTWTSSYRNGWAKVAASDARRPTPQVSPDLQPDRPLRGAIFAPFPKIGEMAFHYKNPVSGRAPAVLLP